MRTNPVAIVSFLVVFSLSASALGQIRQPDNTIIPDGNNLGDILNGRGESINVIDDASLVPEVFFPSQQLTFSFIAEGGSYENAFGWYNVGEDPLDPANRHIVFTCDIEPVAVATIDFCGNPDWNGGPIGFFVITPEDLNNPGSSYDGSCARNSEGGINQFIYFSEPRLNLLEAADPWIHHLVYQSTITPNAFYFGFEDLYRGGDNDFEDVLLFVEGLLVGGPQELCNGMDDDCDGQEDENVVEACTTACGDGLRTCTDGGFGACSAPMPTDEVCDGIDNDCNGDVDEGLTQSCENDCGTGSEVCSDGEWVGCSAPPVREEICDNVDNDCNGEVDDGVTRACTNGCGVAGVETCEAGRFVDCDAPPPVDEMCDGMDNDCDGEEDEDIVQLCLNACGSGLETCMDGDFVGCTAPEASEEVCDGIDNDCDGVIDNGLTRGCESDCGTGTEFCRAGAWIGCTARVPTAEVCDNVDNDCNGDVDDGLTRDCGNACGSGTETCDTGLWVGCTAPTPAPETCDGIDNDCDGTPDDELSIPCASICGEGIAGCVDGEFGECSAPQPESESCDGVDNDCDGLIDEELSRECASACGTGIETCSDGEWQGCSAPEPAEETCDGVDNDCDGVVDNGLSRECTTPCGRGLQTCEFGVWSECPVAEPTDEVCDGGDNDCDGIVDNNATCPVEEICIRGECAAECVNGECPPGQLCENNRCVTDPCLLCRPFEVCRNQVCVDTCAGVDCADGETCLGGECVPGDCYEAGCDQGRVCADGACFPDDCWGVRCPGRALCRFGECIVSCADVVCDDGEQCIQGTCFADPCAGVSCEGTEVCIEGACIEDPCAAIDCAPGFLCVGGDCLENPCLTTSCAPGTECYVRGDGEPDCRPSEDPLPGDDVGVGVDAGDDVGVEPDTGGEPDTGVEPDVGDDDAEPADTSGGGGGGGGNDDSAGTSSGCSSTDSRSPSPIAFLALALLGAVLRRRSTRPKTGGVAALIAAALLVSVGCSGGEEPQTGVGSDTGDGGVMADGGDSGDTGSCTPETERCDGVDNDCDGVVDNIAGADSDPNNCGGCGNVCGFDNADAECARGECIIGTCDPGFANADGLRSNGCEADCEVTFEGDEVCDGVDNDCDGAPDEGFNLNTDPENCGLCGRFCDGDNTAAFDCLSGRCVILECEDGFSNANGLASDGCEYECSVSNNGIEICDGFDNDCDGLTDQMLEESPPFCLNQGVCRGVVGVCQGDDGWTCPYPDLYTSAGETLCNGLDDDCDGMVDEDFAGLGDACDGDDADMCEDGLQVCAPDGGSVICREVRDNVEICDESDNDCDGETDEGFDLMNDDDNCGACRQSCNALNAAGTCNDGTCDITGCQEGFIDINGQPNDGCEYACTPTNDGVEICDGIDNDCDGVADDGVTDDGTTCLTDGVCANVRAVCLGAEGFQCLYPSSYEEGEEVTCDGLDNDCDNMIDEVFEQLGGECDGDDDDMCAGGVYTCAEGGMGVVCTDDEASNMEVCDGVDNDCDESTDEGWDLMMDPDNCGRCGIVCDLPQASSECSAGSCIVTECEDGFLNRNGISVDGCEFECAETNGGVEICDGIDNDCNGTIDDGVTPDDPDACDAPGVCRNLRPTCLGEAGFDCVYPSSFQETETLCDYLDNDCDGDVDEAADNPDLSDVGTSCQRGQGICLRRGVNACTVAGGVACSAEEVGGLDDEICNGLDDDCDGRVDENIPVSSEMVRLTGPSGDFWIDRWEASRPDATADSRGFDSSYACSRPDVLPWDNVTWFEAETICAERGRRLCTDQEWLAACEGGSGNNYPYGNDYDAGTCNTGSGTVDPGGASAMCVSEGGTFDMSGNVAEWADCANDVDCRIVRPFFGGAYDDDVELLWSCWFRSNGAPQLFSSAIGFRCCMDP